MLSRSIEDYLEAIYNLAEKKGYARTKDIAEELKIKPPSVTEMLRKLHDKKLVFYEKSKGVTLTAKGKELAKTVKTRHNTFIKFLEMILIPKSIANQDACEIEHRLHPKTIEQFTKFVDFMSSLPKYCRYLEEFKIYCEEGKIPQYSRKKN